jgi:two-component system sensor histidine kinase UhpB
MERRGLRLRSAGARYGFAVLAVAAAALLQLLWLQFMASPAAAPFLAAIIITGWYAGALPVAAATVLSIVVYVAFAPDQFVELSWTFALRMVWFMGFACLAAWFSAARRKSAEALEEARNALEERVAARTEALRRSEELLLAAQQLSHTGSFSWRLDSGEVMWSEECLRIFGLDAVPLKVQRKDIPMLWHPDDREKAMRVLEDAIREKRGYEREARIVRPDGTIRHIRSVSRPVLDKDGEVEEYIGVIVDVTERVLAEKRLSEAQEAAAHERFVARLDERTRLSRELHDTLLQGFTGVGLKLLAVTKRITGAPETVAELRDVIAFAQQTLESARMAIWDMRPPPRVGKDCWETIWLAAEIGIRDSGLAVERTVHGEPRAVDPEIATTIFRVTEEAITNIVKHAHARTVRITLTLEPAQLRLSIADDGKGFFLEPDLRTYRGHLGLLSMRERASVASGTLSVNSAPGRGTEVVLVVPYSRHLQAAS